MSKQQTDLGKDKIGSLLFKLALPSICAQIINLLYNMIDRMYIGHIKNIGPSALTGVGVAMPVIVCISAFAALVSMGGAPLASINMGKGDKEKAENILGNCTTMLILTALILTSIFLVFGRKIMMLFGASENTIEYAWLYMKIYSFGTIFVQLALGLNAFINAQGFSKIGMTTVAIGAVCNIILDPIFIFGLNMQVQGAALATVISQAVSCIWILKFLTGKKTFLKIKRKYMLLKKNIILPAVALGLSPFIMQFTESVLAVSFNTSLLKYGGDLAVGSMTILNSVNQFCMMPLNGLSQGAQPIVSYNYGAKNVDRVQKAFKLLLKVCVIYSVALWSISMFLPKVFVLIFTSDSELIKYTIWAIKIYMAGSCLFGIQIACQQTFIALRKNKKSIFLALLRKCILLIPLIYIFPLFIANKTFAVFFAEPVADVLAVMCTATMFYFEYRKLGLIAKKG